MAVDAVLHLVEAREKMMVLVTAQKAVELSLAVLDTECALGILARCWRCLRPSRRQTSRPWQPLIRIASCENRGENGGACGRKWER
jgi:hypothetical protein